MAGGRYNHSYQARRFRDQEGNYGTSIYDYRPPYLLDSELAVIQLSEHDSNTMAAMGVEPVCLQRTYTGSVYEYGSYADESNGKVVVDVTGYGVTATGTVRRSPVFMCGGMWDVQVGPI